MIYFVIASTKGERLEVVVKDDGTVGDVRVKKSDGR
jgi:hypothetical protein